MLSGLWARCDGGLASRELIALEARALGLDFDQAVALAKAGTLPEQYPLRADLELLIDLLAA